MCMADGSKVPALKRSQVGEALRASLLRASDVRGSTFYASSRTRTFPWYLALLRLALEDSLRPLRPCSQVEEDEQATRIAHEMIGVMCELMLEHQVIPPVDLVAKTIRTTLGSLPPYERVAYRIIAEIAIHLKNAEQATIKGAGHAYKLQRRSARPRELLPEPKQPSWAEVNRMPSRKVQMPCRVVPDIKALIEDEALYAGISQSRWLEEAIAEKLQRQGHPVYLEARPRASETSQKRPRRTRRAALPDQFKSRHAATNRADRVMTVRISTALGSAIDKARGRKSRAEWLREAVKSAVQTDADLPAPVLAKEALPVAVSLGFDQPEIAALERAADQSDLTKSEWVRRAARRYLSDI